jgi:small subunit ribosomal protein S8
MTDQIADLLIRIKNAGMIRKTDIAMPYSKMKEAILGILKDEGYIKDFEVTEEDGKKTVMVRIASDKFPSHIKQISKPGRRIYSKSKDIPRPLRGFGLVVVSTPKGVISGKTAMKTGVGGEVICEIW